MKPVLEDIIEANIILFKKMTEEFDVKFTQETEKIILEHCFKNEKKYLRCFEEYKFSSKEDFLKVMKRYQNHDCLDEEDDEETESPYRFTHYGKGWGWRYIHPLYDLYRKYIDPHFNIITYPFDERQEKDVVETLKLSLENGKDFYTNAKYYMKEKMIKYERLLKSGVDF